MTRTESDLKSDQIRVRLTTIDKKRIELAAKIRGLSTSEYMRISALESAMSTYVGASKPSSGI